MVRLMAGKSRFVQCVAARKDGWTSARCDGFFAMLSATCNVRASAEAMGMNSCSAYRIRRRDPVFASRWREALADGYLRLEQALMALALEGIDPAPAIEAGIEQARDANGAGRKAAGDGNARWRAAGIAPTGAGIDEDAGAGAPDQSPDLTPRTPSTIGSVDLALRLLTRNADRVAGLAGGRSPKARATPEETDAALIKRLDALARRIAAEKLKQIGGEVVEHGPVEDQGGKLRGTGKSGVAPDVEPAVAPDVEPAVVPDVKPAVAPGVAPGVAREALPA